MRTLFLILMTIAGLFATFATGKLAVQNFKHRGEVSELRTKLQGASEKIAQATAGEQTNTKAIDEALLGDLPTANRFLAGGVASALLALALLALMVQTFRKQLTLPNLAIAVVILAGLMIALNPSFDTGGKRLSPRGLATVFAVAAAFTTAFAYGAHRAWLKTARGNQTVA